MPWREADGAILLTVRVTPKASRTEAIGIVDAGDGRTALAIRVAAPPVEGAANEALVAFLAKALGLRKSAVTVASGETGRLKLLRLEGNSTGLVRQLALLVLPLSRHSRESVNPANEQNCGALGRLIAGFPLSRE
ncbi:MAG: DUF167 domain-containing protein [Proteobacteria bacterium]|nr:DUF167 domain-containing protein [Pseudomonadota bacterium]